MADHSWLPDIFGRDRKSEPFHSLRSEIERVFDDFPRTWGLATKESAFMAPTLDVSETDEAIRISVELPGVDQSEIDVTLVNDLLTIRGEKKSQHEEKGERFHRSERSYGMFQRTIAVPMGIEPSAVQALMKDGVLQITMPKPAEAKAATRKIEVAKA